ncbi:MAG: nucleotidyl transferase AbiEii/AbiGii toxin family protein [Desulfobacula sp.]|jgi:predicted nucleotidyltransferase|nr:nucleotidyl transferase AbiEii/AbiGii toxin family protein [Desulfobacula sp.]
MINIYLDISHKVDPEHKSAILQINKILDELGVKFFIVGASARDFVLEYLHGIRAPRRTMDIDFAVRVKSWGVYEKIENVLLKAKDFKKSKKQKQRFKYGETIIDIVPFGKISDDQSFISWPPEHDIVMSVSGFEDAYNYATQIIISKDPFLEIKVPTIPGMAIMKLISWNDSFPERQKDAQDLYFLLLKYKYTDIIERLYIDNKDLLESEGFDDEISSIRILGQDMAKISSTSTMNEIIQILEKETTEDSDFRLVSNIMEQKYNFDDVLTRLQKLKQGLEEI